MLFNSDLLLVLLRRHCRQTDTLIFFCCCVIPVGQSMALAKIQPELIYLHKRVMNYSTKDRLKVWPWLACRPYSAKRLRTTFEVSRQQWQGLREYTLCSVFLVSVCDPLSLAVYSRIIRLDPLTAFSPRQCAVVFPNRIAKVGYLSAWHSSVFCHSTRCQSLCLLDVCPVLTLKSLFLNVVTNEVKIHPASVNI